MSSLLRERVKPKSGDLCQTAPSRGVCVTRLHSMEILRTVPWEEAIRVWLDSEWYRLPGGVDRRLIDNPDLTDAEENSERLTVLSLHLNRSPILSLLPAVAIAKLVNIEFGDLPKLYIVPSSDWYRDTNGTFLLSDASAYLRPGRRAKIATLEGNLVNYDATTTDQLLILIAVNEDGPYTIIDGNNRAIALHNLHLRRHNMPWRAILIDDPQISHCIWYIESRLAKSNIANLAKLAGLGRLP